MAAELEQLKQLTQVTWDGQVLSKTARDSLVKTGLADRFGGYNFITKKGVRWLVEVNMLTTNGKLFRGGRDGK